MERLKKLFKNYKKLIIGILGILILIGILLSLYLFIRHTYNKDILEKKPLELKSTIPEAIPEPKEEVIDYGVESDIVNVLLVGVDSRGEFNDSRTDSILIASIDPIENKVKLTSLMRDMYVEIPGKGYDKINAAFELGGIDLLKKTIKYNFGLNVDNYVAIDFQSFQNLIDTLDGVEVDVKDYEIKEINKYISEVNGDNSTLVMAPGLQKLNGQQALSYCRIRKVGNNDFERTERQRKVLSLLLSKIKDTKITSYPKLYATISGYVKTNIPFESMLRIGYTVYKFGSASTDSLRLPIDGHFKDTYIKEQSVLIPDLKYSATELYKFIYNTVPQNLKVPDNSKVYNQDLTINKDEKSGATQTNTQPVAATDNNTQTTQPVSSGGNASTNTVTSNNNTGINITTP